MQESSIRNDDMICIGTNIKKIRNAKHIKATALIRDVNLLGVDLNTFSLSKIEANTQHIKASQLKAIATALKCDISEFFN